MVGAEKVEEFGQQKKQSPSCATTTAGWNGSAECARGISYACGFFFF